MATATLPNNVKEVRIVFDDRSYLEKICDQMVGTLITGYNITENQTTYVWNGRQHRATNYVASTIVRDDKVKPVVSHSYQQIIKKWKTPLIQVLPCFVPSTFEEYLIYGGK